MDLKPKKVMVTCYDSTFAHLIAGVSEIDFVLVGDSLGMVLYGATSTLEVTMDQMLTHTKGVSRGLKHSLERPTPLLVADMPVGSYENPVSALKNAQSFLEVGAQMVKVEGPVLEVVRKLRASQIRVCGHIGLTPQSIQDYKVQGRTALEAKRLKTEAKDLEGAGCELLVLEMIPRELAREITEELKIPTIGIGAGPDCSGQVLVLYDLLGLNESFKPKFLKTYLPGASLVRKALSTYAEEVREGIFPSASESFHSRVNLIEKYEDLSKPT